MARYWTEERVAALTRMVRQEGLIYEVIAERLGDGCTTGMISAKVDRLGIGRGHQARNQLYKSRKHGVAKLAVAALRADVQHAAAMARMEMEQALRDDLISIHDLDEVAPSCRHIAGEPVGDVRYCGKPSVMGLSWCVDHARRCLGGSGGLGAEAGDVFSLPDRVRELCAA